MKYKVGDKVKVAKTIKGFHAMVGDEVIVEGVKTDIGSPYLVRSKSGSKKWVFEGEIEPMTNTIEVNGKKYEECDYKEYVKANSILFMSDGINSKYYKEVKKEFKTTIEAFDVKEEEEGLLRVGCSLIRLTEIENLLKEYREYLKTA